MEVDFRDFELDCAGGSSLKVGEQNEFCGSKKPDNVLTSTSDLKFNMVIKKAGNYRGFRATFSLRERSKLTMHYNFNGFEESERSSSCKMDITWINSQ